MKSLFIEECKWGLEHEFPVIKDKVTFCDFSNTTFADLDRIVSELPMYKSDYPNLRVGDLGIKEKRWYIEGFERFDENGKFNYAIPKGMEIRTPVCASLAEAVATLKKDFTTWQERAAPYGYQAASVSFNPFHRGDFIPQPPENAWERSLRVEVPEHSFEHVHMLTFGPDVNFSHSALTTAELVDFAQKLTYYSPFIVAFSFSSPFFEGALWNGLSRRTFYRTGRRATVKVFIDDPDQLITSSPTLTRRARLPEEVGRIEFKALDMFADLDLYQSFGTLLFGLLLDDTLKGRALTPDTPLHQEAAIHGFASERIQSGAAGVLAAATKALPETAHSWLLPLEAMLQKREVEAHRMIKQYNKTKDIITTISL